MPIPNLSVFAEVSVALLGFSGLASALSSVSAKNRAFITIRLKALLVVSGSACFGSLAPLTELGLYYCCILLTMLTAGTVFTLGRDFLKASDVSPSPFLVVLTVGWALAAITFQGFALVFDPSLVPVAYMFALSGTITVAILFFIRFVLAMVQDLG
ncbi:MAG: hypothetical protein AAGG11_08680 [Pseudomonadota bacterium]